MYKYFKDSELTCKHCNAEGIDPAFMQKVDKLRDELGFPFPITSAYRCKDHPIEARKFSPGAHESGRAVDIGVRGKNAYKLVQAATKAGLTGIGISQKGGTRFIHIDDLPDSEERPRPHIWSY